MSITEISAVEPVSPVTAPAASAGTSSAGGTAQSLLSAMQASSPGISPTAIFLMQLADLQRDFPAEYAQVADRISTQLQNDGQTAAAAGNATQADKLSHLATVFASSAQSGTLPTVDALHEAGLSKDHFHGHGLSQDAALTPPAPVVASDSIESILASEVSNAITSLNS